MCIVGFDTGVETNNTISVIRMIPYKLLYNTYQPGHIAALMII